jgi:hypothetical protein
LAGTPILPAAVRAAIEEESQGNLNVLHILQELGVALVLAGLVAAWFTWHYEQSVFFHWSLTLFWALLALVHWFDVRGPNDSIGGPLVLTVPFLWFVALGALRATAERQPRPPPD